jgi:transcriptional regulator with XRE-family HTH domain
MTSPLTETGVVPLSTTPEGALVRRLRKLTTPELSIRAAANRIGISPESLGDIERGQVRAGRGRNTPPALKLAKIVHALGGTPDQLRNEGERPDAAKELEAILAAEGPGQPARAAGRTRHGDLFPMISPELRPLVEARYTLIATRVEVAAAARPDGPLPGGAVFPGQPAYASKWDRLPAHWTADQHAEALAVIQALEGDTAARRPSGRAAAGGLPHRQSPRVPGTSRFTACFARSRDTTRPGGPQSFTQRNDAVTGCRGDSRAGASGEGSSWARRGCRHTVNRHAPLWRTPPNWPGWRC